MEQYPKIYLYKRIVQAKLYMDANYFKPLNLKSVAEEAYFSKFHFTREFARLYGKTPHQYLISVRIEQAKFLLSQNIPVTDCCYHVGFESPGSFTNLFKKMVGVTPSSFIRQQQNRKIAIEEAPLKFIPGCFAEKSGWTHK